MVEWSWCPAPQDTTLRRIFHPNKTFCFLAGSRISADSPSCLPTEHQFTQTLLRRLIPLQKRESILALMNPAREDMRDSRDFLCFERLMNYLQQDFDPNLRMLDDYAECTKSNFNHLFFAHIMNLSYFQFLKN